MAHKMGIGSRPKEEYEKKLVGLVEVVTGKTKAKFTLTEESKTFKNGEKALTVAFTDLPSRPKLKPEQREGKMYRIRMSQDGSEIEAITPAMGHYHAKLVDLGKRPEEGADPIPFEKVFGEGTPKENRHFEFFAVYEIVEGAFKGVQLPAYYMHYKFEEDPEHEGYTRFAGSFDNTKATRLFQLRDWGNAHGVWEDPIEWNDVTILPTLLERALENDRVVDLTIKDGYIKELLPLQSEDEDEDEPDFMKEPAEDDELDETPAKKPAKPVAKPAVKKPAKKSSDDDDDL